MFITDDVLIYYINFKGLRCTSNPVYRSEKQGKLAGKSEGGGGGGGEAGEDRDEDVKTTGRINIRVMTMINVILLLITIAEKLREEPL